MGFNVLLLFNTIKYLKPIQLLSRVTNSCGPKDQFHRYETHNIRYSEYDLWIEGMDEDNDYLDRFETDELLKGRLVLLNKTGQLNVWEDPSASHLWNFNVHYLEYLIPLKSLWRSTGNTEYKIKINDIIDSWYRFGSFLPDSNHPYTISLRIVNLLIVADLVEDKQKLYDVIYAQYRYLLKHQEKHLLGNHYLENLKAIVISSIVFDEYEIYNKYVRKLLKELNEQITPDGLHYELSLMYHKIILEDMIRMALIMRQRGLREVDSVISLIGKMTDALYSLELGCGRTLLFNDAGDNVSKSTGALLSACEKLFDFSPGKYDYISGYYKLYNGNVTVVMDCGKLSPDYMPGHGHCDCLSFEMFYDGIPVLVNSGTYQYQGEMRQYFRSTAAHNTVVINGHEQSELWGEHRAGRRIRNIKSSRSGSTIKGEYQNYHGEKHRRQLSLTDGVLEIKDAVDGDGESYLHLANGYYYSDGYIVKDKPFAKVIPINSDISAVKMYYAPEFGKKVETDTIVFSWKADDDDHGYRIELIERSL